MGKKQSASATIHARHGAASCAHKLCSAAKPLNCAVNRLLDGHSTPAPRRKFRKRKEMAAA